MRSLLAGALLLAGCISPEADLDAEPQNGSVTDEEAPAPLPTPEPRPAENETPAEPAGPRVETFELNGTVRGAAGVGLESADLTFEAFAGATEVRAWAWWNGSFQGNLVVSDPKACRFLDMVEDAACRSRGDPHRHETPATASDASLVVPVPEPCANEAGCTWAVELDPTLADAATYHLLAEVVYAAPSDGP